MLLLLLICESAKNQFQSRRSHTVEGENWQTFLLPENKCIINFQFTVFFSRALLQTIRGVRVHPTDKTSNREEQLKPFTLKLFLPHLSVSLSLARLIFFLFCFGRCDFFYKPQCCVLILCPIKKMVFLISDCLLPPSMLLAFAHFWTVCLSCRIWIEKCVAIAIKTLLENQLGFFLNSIAFNSQKVFWCVERSWVLNSWCRFFFFITWAVDAMADCWCVKVFSVRIITSR